MRKFRPLLLLVTSMLLLCRGASGAMVTYGFVGTADLLTPYDPYHVLLLPIEPAVTPVSGTFTVDTAAIDGDASISTARYDFAGIDSLVVMLGDYYRFRSDTTVSYLRDDLPTAIPEWGLIDTFSVGATTGFDPVILPDFGYAVHTTIMGFDIRDIGEDAITLPDAIASIPDLTPFGPPDAVGQLQIIGCGLRGVVAGSCGANYNFRINASIDDIFVVPEPATAGLVTLGVAALAASRRRRGVDRAARVAGP